MWYLWVLVQRTADTVANILSHCRKSLRLSICLNRGTDIAKLLIWSRLLDTQFQAALRHIHKSLRFAVKLPQQQRHARVTDPTFIEHPNINADDVSLAQISLGLGIP